MPFGSEGVEPGVGLALSGGGFRATLFHLGSLWRLTELGCLPRLNRISSVSGGSITAGYLAVRWNQLLLAGGAAANFKELVVQPLRDFCRRSIDGPAIGEGALLPWKRVSDAVEEEYRKHLYGEATLQDLPNKPRFVFNATNFGTGVGFRFSKPYAGDYRIGRIPNPTFRVSLAVTASSAFPPFLSPVRLALDPAAFQRWDGADLYDQEAYRKVLYLTDGGVYDNLGLETVWNRYDTVLVSDAGAPFDPTPEVETAWHSQAYRASNVATNQARALRKRALIDDFKRGIRKGTYWGIKTDIRQYGLPDALTVLPQHIETLARLRTRLNEFTEAEQCCLINWGYAVCDAAMRKHVTNGRVPAAEWPYPKYRLDQQG